MNFCSGRRAKGNVYLGYDEVGQLLRSLSIRDVDGAM
jgi:hypothetical protein